MAKKRNRPNYDIDPDIQNWIDETAAEFDIPKSRIVNYLLAKGIIEFDDGDFLPRLKASRSPIFGKVIDIDDLLNKLK